LVNEKTKVVTSQKSFSGSGSQTLFSAEPVTEKIRLRSQATKCRALVFFASICNCALQDLWQLLRIQLRLYFLGDLSLCNSGQGMVFM